MCERAEKEQEGMDEWSDGELSFNLKSLGKCAYAITAHTSGARERH